MNTDINIEFGKPLRILLVDDEEVDRMLVARALKKSGLLAELFEASNSDDARKSIYAEPYDCIFLDHRLPGDTGTTLLREVRERGYRTPIILITSHADPQLAVDVMKSGGSDFLSKEMITPEGISQVLRNALRVFNAEEHRLETSQALERSQQRLAEAQRIAQLGHFDLDLERQKLECSEQMLRILGYDPAEKEAQQPNDFVLQHIRSQDYDLATKILRKCLEDGNDGKIDVKIVTLKGTYRDVELHFRPVEQEGRIRFVQGTIQDITVRKETERALQQARDLAEKNARLKEEFLANMSHEIRTPMNAILGFTKLLTRTELNEEQSEFLSAIETSGETLLTIINDILDLSKIEAGRLNFEVQPFSLRQLLESLIQINHVKAEEKNLTLHYRIGPGVPDQISGDQIRLNQILINLIGNALKFTEEGEVLVEVRKIDGDDKRVRLLFEVVDTGIGIEEDRQKAIFDSFTQARNDTTRKYGGTGLGLTICKRIVDLQGGRIGVESEPGHGANFFFELEFGVGETIEQSSTEGPPTQLNQIQGMRVLVVEDHPLNQKLVLKMLENLGVEAVLATSGVEALSILEDNPGFDQILMDIQMPEMDGYETTAHIRSHNQSDISQLPIIAVTAHAFSEEALRTKAAGMNGFLTKPFSEIELAQALAGKDLTHFENPIDVEKILDLQQVRELSRGNVEFEAEMIQLFCKEIPKEISNLETAIDKEAYPTIREILHRIKPTLLLFGIPNAAVLSDEIKRIAVRQGKADQFQGLFAQLKERVQSALNQLKEAET